MSRKEHKYLHKVLTLVTNVPTKPNHGFMKHLKDLSSDKSFGYVNKITNANNRVKVKSMTRDNENVTRMVKILLQKLHTMNKTRIRF